MLVLEELRMQGLECVEIARQLGRTVASIKMKCMSAEIPLMMLRRQEFFSVLSSSHTMREAAASLGICVGAVSVMKNKLRKQGFSIPDATRVTKRDIPTTPARPAEE